MVATYGRYDTNAALDWLVVAVKLARNVASPSLNGEDAPFEKDQAPSLKRISGLTPISDFTSNTAGFSLQSAIAVFPPDQFEPVLSILREIPSPETRGLALLTLCRTFLKTAPTTKVATSRQP
jgi:hypothetical protein